MRDGKSSYQTYNLHLGGGGRGGDGVAALAMCGFAWADWKALLGWLEEGLASLVAAGPLARVAGSRAGDMPSIFAGAKSIYGFYLWIFRPIG